MTNKVEEVKKQFVELLIKRLEISKEEIEEYEEDLWEEEEEYEECSISGYEVIKLLHDLWDHLPQKIKDEYIYFRAGNLEIDNELIDALFKVLCEDFRDSANFPPWEDYE